MKAIPTDYHDVSFRSRLEARWAFFFDTLNIRWQYEPVMAVMGTIVTETYVTNDNYIPDFYLNDYDVWMEVKPVYPEYEALHRIARFVNTPLEHDAIEIITPHVDKTPVKNYVDSLDDLEFAYKPQKAKLEIKRTWITNTSDLLLVYGAFYQSFPEMQLWKRENRGMSIEKCNIEYFGRNLDYAIKRAMFHKF